MSTSQQEPTEQDNSTLIRAHSLERRFGSGIFSHGGAQASHFRKLCRYGMLEFTGEYGHDLDGEVDGDLPIYQLTEAGRAYVESLQDV